MKNVDASKLEFIRDILVNYVKLDYSIFIIKLLFNIVVFKNVILSIYILLQLEKLNKTVLIN